MPPETAWYVPGVEGSSSSTPCVPVPDTKPAELMKANLRMNGTGTNETPAGYYSADASPEVPGPRICERLLCSSERSAPPSHAKVSV
jgi:hypothetical protein